MKLFYSPFHGFVHKALVTLHEAGVADRVELIASFPFRDMTGEFVTGQFDTTPINPFGKVPILALDDGTVLYGSQVVVEYLDSLSAGPRLYPAAGAERFDALRRLALGDGIFEFAVQLTMEGWRPEAERRHDLYDWLGPKIRRGLAQAASEVDGWRGFDIGHVGLLQGISFVEGWVSGDDPLIEAELRDWRDRWPALADWFATQLKRPSVTSHYQQPFTGDASAARHQAAVDEVLALRARR